MHGDSSINKKMSRDELKDYSEPNMLDVIVITKDNENELMSTLGSLLPSLNIINRIIIIDDSMVNNNDKVKQVLKDEDKFIYCFQQGGSIYGAFNKAMKFITSDYIFINSGDLLISMNNKITHRPVRLQTIGLKDGNVTKILRPNRLFLWFNHQSIIFDRNYRGKFDEKYKIAADFDFYLKYVRMYGTPKCADIKTGLIGFDLSGISARRKLSRDLEYVSIYMKNGYPFRGFIFIVIMLFKAFLGRYA